jgi:hypothetical protein
MITSENKEDIWIESQVKFMYGKFYDLLINNKQITRSNFNTNRDYIRYKVFIDDIIPYLDNKRRIFDCDWGDSREINEFVITHNRKYNSNSNPIFFLHHYNFPVWKLNFNDTIPFENKKSEIIWRGATSGNAGPDTNIRLNIVSKNFNLPNINIGFTNGLQLYNRYKDKYDNFFKEKMSPHGQFSYKYILCMEGNDWATNFPWALSSNSVPFHNYPFKWESWIFGNGLEPWVHFIPIKNDGSDLQEKLKWAIKNNIECYKISENGKEYMKNYSNKSITDKLFKRFLELYPIFED